MIHFGHDFREIKQFQILYEEILNDIFQTHAVIRTLRVAINLVLRLLVKMKILLFHIDSLIQERTQYFNENTIYLIMSSLSYGISVFDYNSLLI